MPAAEQAATTWFAISCAVSLICHRIYAIGRAIDRHTFSTPGKTASLLASRKRILCYLYYRIGDADLILLPILPSPIDIHSAAAFIRDIQMTGRLHEQNKQLLVVANRVRANTVMFSRLNEFLQGLGLPRVTYTRDSQLCTRAAAQGLAISDLRGKPAAEEQDHWSRIGNWIEHQLAQRQGAVQRARMEG